MFWRRSASFKSKSEAPSTAAGSTAASPCQSQAGSRAVSSTGQGLQTSDPGLLNADFYSCPGDGGFKIRGSNYLKDKKKVPAAEPQLRLASVHLVEVPQPTFDITSHLPNIKDPSAPLTFVLQLMVPGPPYLALTMAWSRSPPAGHCNGTAAGNHASNGTLSPFEQLMAIFLEGDGPEADKKRHKYFKLIPSVVQASWIIKQAVGQKPVMLGQKLTTKYCRGPGYFEVDVDVGSSRSAAAAVGLVSGATRSMVIDMAVLLEGQTPEQLPEELLGTVRFSHLDMKQAPFLDTATGILHPSRPKPS